MSRDCSVECMSQSLCYLSSAKYSNQHGFDQKTTLSCGDNDAVQTARREENMNTVMNAVWPDPVALVIISLQVLTRQVLSDPGLLSTLCSTLECVWVGVTHSSPCTLGWGPRRGQGSGPSHADAAFSLAPPPSAGHSSQQTCVSASASSVYCGTEMFYINVTVHVSYDNITVYMLYCSSIAVYVSYGSNTVCFILQHYRICLVANHFIDCFIYAYF